MRDLKFRAWDTRTKYMATQGTPDLETLHRFIDHWAWEQHEIDNGVIILMQYTGLTDKNDREIYEGDIVRDGYHDKYGTYAVVWDGRLHCWTFSSTDGRELEVIGNVHENPELLK